MSVDVVEVDGNLYLDVNVEYTFPTLIALPC